MKAKELKEILTNTVEFMEKRGPLLELEVSAAKQVITQLEKAPDSSWVDASFYLSWLFVTCKFSGQLGVKNLGPQE